MPERFRIGRLRGGIGRSMATPKRLGSGTMGSMRGILWTRRVLSWHVPHYDRGGFYLQAMVIVAIDVGWQSYQFAPGWAVAILAVVAVVMTVRADHYTKTEQVIWVLVALSLMVVEIRAITRDRNVAETQRRVFEQQLQDRFQQTANSLGAVIRESDAHFDATIGKIGQAINTETGGDTFCYLDMTFSPIWENGKETTRGYLRLEAVRVGKYPLRDVSITIDDHIKFGTVMNDLRKRDTHNFTTDANDKVLEEMEQAGRASRVTIQVGNFAVGSKALGGYPINDSDVQEFDVLIRLFNLQTFIERITMRRTNGHWSKAILLELPQKKGHLWTKIDKTFPTKDGHLEVGWPRPTKGRADWDH